MPGERLMCVWQAVWSRDESPEAGVKKAILKNVTESFRDVPILTYSESKFDEIFHADVQIDFDLYKSYVENTLCSPGVPRHMLTGKIEDVCWEIIQQTKQPFISPYLSSDDIKKLWQIFNQLCEKNSYTHKGIMSDSDEINWFMEKTAEVLGRKWDSSNFIPEEGMSFKDFLYLLDVTYFASVPPVQTRQCIDELHNWLVKEILKVGWMSKRNKILANWTIWMKRWFVLTPTGLLYYDNEACETKKGEILLDCNMEVKSMSDVSSLSEKHKFRFAVINRPNLDMELAAGSEFEKQEWIDALQIVIDSEKVGSTPLSYLLQQRARLKKEAFDLEKKLTARRAQTKPISVQLDVTDDSGIRKSSSANEIPNGVTNSHTSAKTPASIESDWNAIEVQKEKVKVVFLEIDTNGNGKVDKEEFCKFLEKLGLVMDKKESSTIFDTVNKDGNEYIDFEEFYDYFVGVVMGESSGTESEAKLRSAFIAADRDGSGTVSFQEFAEYATNCRRDLAMEQLLKAFADIDKDKSGDVSVAEFHNYISQTTQASATSPSDSKDKQAIGNMLRNVYDDADVTQLASNLLQRWDSYAGFKRHNASGDLVMKGGKGMVDDVLPGEYSLIDLACFNELPPVEPRHAVAKVKWIKSSVPGKSGHLFFPNDFDEKIPFVIATNESLAYYGASLADKSQCKISLLYRHGIQDFSYENNYLEDYVLEGGAGIESHGFSHLDCPLDDDSGCFVLGKMEGEELHITAFKIPPRQTLYVPPFTIHSNDYLRGTWRTMLSDETEIDHVRLYKYKNDTENESYDKFKLTFDQLK